MQSYFIVDDVMFKLSTEKFVLKVFFIVRSIVLFSMLQLATILNEAKLPSTPKSVGRISAFTSISIRCPKPISS